MPKDLTLVDVVTLAVLKLRISEAVSSIFDELKAEGGYLRDGESSPSRLSLTRQPRTSTLESRSRLAQEVYGFVTNRSHDTGIVNMTKAGFIGARLWHDEVIESMHSCIERSRYR